MIEVGDHILIVLLHETKAISTSTAVIGIGSIASEQEVVTITPLEMIIASPAKQFVVSGTTQYLIIAITADQLVVAAITKDFVVAITTIEVILEGVRAMDVIITILSKNPVAVVVCALDVVITSPAFQNPFIGACVGSCHPIVAIGAIDPRDVFCAGGVEISALVLNEPGLIDVIAEAIAEGANGEGGAVGEDAHCFDPVSVFCVEGCVPPDEHNISRINGRGDDLRQAEL